MGKLHNVVIFCSLYKRDGQHDHKYSARHLTKWGELFPYTGYLLCENCGHTFLLGLNLLHTIKWYSWIFLIWKEENENLRFDGNKDKDLQIGISEKNSASRPTMAIQKVLRML